MKDELKFLIEKCRDSEQYLTPNDVLKRCFDAGEQRGKSRIRRISHAVQKEGPPPYGRNIKWIDFRSALMSATRATWQEEHGTWRLAGGLDGDGKPLVVPVVVFVNSEDVYVWTGFAP